MAMICATSPHSIRLLSLSTALLGWLESHTGIRKVYLASVLLFFLLLLVFRGTGLGIVSICV
ncbi:MAG: hypothetical protein Q7T57_08095, partial [Dehalococcoidales bacterium]|nr:hypothetical protein [Dehalococcoidales bacterium]